MAFSQAYLDRKFKPIFERYHEESIPLRVISEEVNIDPELAQVHISPRAKKCLLKNADIDRDGKVSYKEFSRMMTHLSTRQKVLRAAISTVVPGKAKTPQRTNFVEDYVENYRCCPPPIFIPLISLAQAGVFAYYVFKLKEEGVVTTLDDGWDPTSPLVWNPKRRFEAWRYLSYMFLHLGYYHIIFNLIVQVLLGIPLELVHQWWRIAIVYLLGVIAGSLAHSIVIRKTYLLGASGGVYALMGAHVANIIMNWKEMNHDWAKGAVRVILSAPVRLAFWLLLAGADLSYQIYNSVTDPAGSNVGVVAHVGGLLCGLLIGIPVLRNLQELPWERVLFIVAIIVYLLLVIFAVLWNAFFPDYLESDPMPGFSTT